MKIRGMYCAFAFHLSSYFLESTPYKVKGESLFGLTGNCWVSSSQVSSAKLQKVKGKTFCKQ